MKKILPHETTLSKIKCPICGAGVEISNGASLTCLGQRRHCYDFSASGYVNLMPPGHTAGGDSKGAVAARRAFLGLDLYKPAADALADTLAALTEPTESTVVDAGCGEGYYTSILAKKGFSVCGIDISRFAAEAAAKRTSACGLENGFFAVGSVYSLPFFDSSVDCVTNVFAPCSEKEFERVLKNGGLLAVVYAGPDHLMGLKKLIYDETRQNDERADLPLSMKLAEQRRVTFDITVEGNENIQNLFAMTPYYWRTSPADSEKLKGVDRLETTVDMIIAIYRKEETK